MVARRPTLAKAERYYDGQHNLAFQSKKFQEAFGGLFKAFADNWCGVVVGACEERLNLTGFRVDEGPDADKDAWRIWQYNELDLQSQMAHTEALSLGVSYVTVWYSDDDTMPEITVDSAFSTIVESHPKHRQRRLAGLRCWVDEVGYEHAELFLPDTVYAFRSTKPRDAQTGLPDAADQTYWIVDPDNPDVDEADGSMVNPLGVVPIVELINRPRLHRSQRAGWAVHSEIASIIPLQDAANKLIADMMVSSEFAAFPQRWVIGFDDDKGDGAQRFKAGPGMVWWLETGDTGSEGKFGQFQTADLHNYVAPIEMVVQHIASISATPPHYLRASADRLSGESLKTAETGLVAKCRRRMVAFSDPWEDVQRLAGKVAGIERLANATSMETIWGDPESRTEGEHIDAALKKIALGVPLPQIWQDIGYTPQQIERFKAMRAEDALLGLIAQPTPAPGVVITEPKVHA